MSDTQGESEDVKDQPPGARLVGHISFEKATDQGEFDAEDAVKFYRWVEEQRKAEEPDQ